ncbi:MAG: hypothetical protein M0015_03480 [Betaproteobacteria bacterium]|nr:hypothetical protein [Betaproteobacteria bacterium]
MNLTAAEIRKLLLPALACAALLAAGVALVLHARHTLLRADQQLAAAREDRNKAAERLSRIAEEEREVREKLAVYQRLKALHIIGEERRLEWADAMARIKTSRDLLDLRYRVERQKLLVSVPGKPASVDFYSSTMKVQIALLDENDLLDFLHDLRDSGNAYYSVRSCSITRVSQAPTAGAMAPRLSADCDIDLITILDRAAKA